MGAASATALAGSAPVADPAWIAATLASILELDTVGPDEDFFVLGGDSTAAVALMTEIEARTGQKLGISILLEAPTPARLAERLRRAAAPGNPLLLPVQETGRGLPIFLVHGLLGQVFIARYLRHGTGDRPIWGIQAAPQDPATAPPRPVASLAEDYIAAIRSVRPTGPYLLGGYCAGTFIAWEMAQRLREAGETIPLLFAIDPPPVIGDYIGGRAANAAEGPLSDGRFLAKARIDIRRTAARHRDFHWIRNDPAALGEAVATAAALRHAFIEYRPTPYDGDVVFFCSANKARLMRLPDSPWRALVGGTPAVERLARRHTELFVPKDPTLGEAMVRAMDARGI